MSWLSRVIGLVLRTTPAAGPAPLPTACPTGGEHSIAAEPQSVSQKQSPELCPAQPITAEPSPKSATPPAPTRTKKSSAAGSKQATPARQTRQPAGPAKKPAKKAVSPTKAGAKRTPAKTPAQTRTVRRSKGSGS